MQGVKPSRALGLTRVPVGSPAKAGFALGRGEKGAGLTARTSARPAASHSPCPCREPKWGEVRWGREVEGYRSLRCIRMRRLRLTWASAPTHSPRHSSTTKSPGPISRFVLALFDRGHRVIRSISAGEKPGLRMAQRATDYSSSSDTGAEKAADFKRMTSSEIKFAFYISLGPQVETCLWLPSPYGQ